LYSSVSSTKVLTTSIYMDSLDATAQVHRHIATDSRLERSSPRFTRALTTSVSMDSLDATTQVHRLRLETRAIVLSTVSSFSSASSRIVLTTPISMDSLDASAPKFVATASRLERLSPRSTRRLATAVSINSLDVTAQVRRRRLETRAIVTSLHESADSLGLNGLTRR